MADPAFVLLGYPVEFVVADGCEFVCWEGDAGDGEGEEGVEDAKVYEVPVRLEVSVLIHWGWDLGIGYLR